MRMESNFRDQMIKSGSKKSAHEYLTEHDGDFEVWYTRLVTTPLRMGL